jgi:FkbM family methyltransferase
LEDEAQTLSSLQSGDTVLSYTANFEDVLLERCFRDVERGFFIDIGAHHPTYSSVTKWFYDRGWWGINVEPGPGIQAFHNERPRDINLEVAVSDFEGEAQFWLHMGNTGTSTLQRDIADLVAQRAGDIRAIEVKVTTLQSIVDNHAAATHVHFLKVDAEGTENAIVLSTNWRRWRPEVIVIESTEPYTNTRRIEAWQQRLNECGYKMAYFDGVNDFWVREESSHLLKQFTVPVNVLDFFKLYDPELEALRIELQSARQQLASQSNLKAGLRQDSAELEALRSELQSVREQLASQSGLKAGLVKRVLHKLTAKMPP